MTGVPKIKKGQICLSHFLYHNNKDIVMQYFCFLTILVAMFDLLESSQLSLCSAFPSPVLSFYTTIVYTRKPYTACRIIRNWSIKFFKLDVVLFCSVLLL